MRASSQLCLWVSLLLSACTSTGPQQNQDAFVGGVTGALIGSQFGHGEGRLIGVGLGAIIGGTIGGAVGEKADHPAPVE